MKTDLTPRSLSRRHFLAGAVAMAGVGLAGPNVAVGGEPRTIGFCYSTYGMKGVPTEQALRIMAEVGYDSAELALLAGWDADPLKLSSERRQSIRKQLQDSRLKLAALMENLPPSDDATKHATTLERLKAAAQLAHELSPEHLPLIETVLGGGPDWAKGKAVFLRQLPDWVKVAGEQGVVIAIKPHRGNAMNTVPQVIELLNELGNPPRLRMVYDYSHFAMRDMPMDDTIRSALPATAFISIKDVAMENGKAVFKLPGETGQIDYAALLKQFYAGGYGGNMNCEVSAQVTGKAGFDPIETAKKCYASIAPAFAAAGVPRPKRG